MRIFTNPYSISFFVVLSCVLMGCKKQNEFLDAKPNQSLVVPSSLNDYELLLRNEGLFNTFDPALAFVSSGEFYVPDDVLIDVGVSPQTNAYLWLPDIYQGNESNDWNNPYLKIYYANTVLDGISMLKVDPNLESELRVLKGRALFYRAWSFYNLVQTFALPYDSVTANDQLGIPLRLTSDLNVKSFRASEKECYDRIIFDLENAVQLLPESTELITQGSKVSAYALLARVSLAIGDYKKALDYSNLTIHLHSSLLNYNDIQVPDDMYANPFSLMKSNFLSEDLYHSTLASYQITGTYRCVVDSVVYNSYESNDLRKSMLFVTYNGARFKGSYDIRDGRNYNGLAVDEIYLIRAEAYARGGDVHSALNDLNTLLLNRYATGTFTPKTITDADSLLDIILLERRKELIFRGLYWTDIRRLKNDPNRAVNLERFSSGQRYTLPMNSNKYALPIPDQEIQLNHMQQNERN